MKEIGGKSFDPSEKKPGNPTAEGISGAEIWVLRKEAGFTREDLASKTGLSSKTIYRLESGQRVREKSAAEIKKTLDEAIQQEPGLTGEELRLWRQRYEVTQQGLADRIGMSKKSIGRLESGKDINKQSTRRIKEWIKEGDTELTMEKVAEVRAAKKTIKVVKAPHLTGEELRVWRERTGLSREALARMVGVSSTSFYAYESGRYIGRQYVKKIKDWFKEVDTIQVEIKNLRRDPRERKWLQTVASLPISDVIRNFRVAELD